ncbi:MAG TPA: DNA glycosylase [Fimbriimonadaceae bacterium]|nr:DNA glycosylase [Fimbriimonadaceae bacterium]
MNYEYTIDLQRDPIDLETTLTCGQCFRWTQKETDWHGCDGANRYVIRQDQDCLSVQSNAPETSFRRLFRLDLDLGVIHAELQSADSRLSPIIERLSGLRLMRPSDPTEPFFAFICSANNHVPRITSMVQKLATYGTAGFPTTASIATIPESELREQGFGYRARSCVRAAQYLLESGGMERLASLDYEMLKPELLKVPFVGPKLADCIALYSFDKTEAVPVDTHLWNAAASMYLTKPPVRVSAKTYDELTERMRDRFGSLAGFAQQFLFVDRLRSLGSGRWSQRPRG